MRISVQPVDLTPHSLGTNSDANSTREKILHGATDDDEIKAMNTQNHMCDPENSQEDYIVEEKPETSMNRVYIENLSGTPKKTSNAEEKSQLNISTAKIFSGLDNQVSINVDDQEPEQQYINTSENT